MSKQGLRFTLEIDGLMPNSTAVVSFTLRQHFSNLFTLTVDIASHLSGLTTAHFIEKNATLTVWQGDVA